MIALWWAACENAAPVLEAVNGVDVQVDLLGRIQVQPIAIRAGEVLDLTVALHDPDGDAVEVHFADMPGWVDFDPSGTSGTLEVFDTPLGDAIPLGLLLLVDDQDPPAFTEAELPFFYAVE